MTVNGNWTGFFLVLGGLTSAAGVLGLCIFRDSPALRPVQGDTYLRDVLYAFRPANIRANKMIYICFFGMMFSGLAMQMWQPYMISLVEVTLGIENYILPIGIVVLASAVLSVLAGKVMDRFGKEKFYYPVAILQVLGGLIAYSIKFVGHAMPLLCVGGTCIMAGNLAMAGLFTASARDYTPEGRRRVAERQDGHLHRSAHGARKHSRSAHHPGRRARADGGHPRQVPELCRQLSLPV